MTSNVNFTEVLDGVLPSQRAFLFVSVGHTRVSAKAGPVTSTVDPAEIRGLGTT